MKRKSIIVILLLCSLLLTACGEEKELGAWEMPTVDAKPTVAPTSAPVYGGGSPESYVWNEATGFDMAYPGAAKDSLPMTYKHTQCLDLFPYTFLPSTIFGESYAKYPKLRLRKTEHDVMLDGNDLSLAEHSYVEYKYYPQSNDEDSALTVMAELCSYVTTCEIYQDKAYPHISFADYKKPVESSYYLKSFVLSRCEDLRIAQILKLTPKSYFTDVAAASAEAEANGESYTPARQVFLTITCGSDMSDEEFIAAVCALLTYSDGSENPPVQESRLPVMGEKGAA